MVKTQKEKLRYQIQIKEIVGKVKVMNVTTGKPCTTYKTRSKIIPLYDTELRLEQIKKLIERCMGSAEKKK